MPHSIFKLPLIRYRFDYNPSQAIKLPPYPGKLWHGALGNALKNVLCIMENQACEQCRLVQTCDYPYLFKPVRHQSSGILQHQKDIPSPHIIQFTHNTFQVFEKDQLISVDLVLIGNANARLPTLIQAMLRLGQLGLHHKPMQLHQVTQQPNEFSARIIWKNQQNFSPSDFQPHSLNVTGSYVHIDFISQYIQRNNHEFDLYRWIMSIIRRLSALHINYHISQSTVDYTALKKWVTQCQLLHLNLNPYRNQFTKQSQTSGVLGSFIIKLSDAKQLLPWLYLGQWINSGRLASSGYGRYQMSMIDGRDIK